VYRWLTGNRISTVPDPRLTALGEQQASSGAAQIADLQDSVDLIVTSPLKRTLQTTLRTWGPAVKRLGIENVICLAEAQECNDYPCDTGSPREELEKDPDFAGLTFARVTPDWTSKANFWAADRVSIANRCEWVRHFLRDRPEKHIVLVAHGDFLRELTCDAHGASTYWWKNVEIQIFKFDETTVDQDECFLKLDSLTEATGAPNS